VGGIERFIVVGQLEPASHYCHAVRAGDRIWISGTAGIDSNGVAPKDTVEKFEVAIGNLDVALRQAGGVVSDIVKVTVFLTNIEDRSRINPIHQHYFRGYRPASTLIEVSKLVLPALKVEIEAEAVIQR
jgi:2-iminobutanoate/2-iminopropanoate deaminase